MNNQRESLNNFHPTTVTNQIPLLTPWAQTEVAPGLTAMHLWGTTGLLDIDRDGAPIHNAPEHMLKVAVATDTIAEILVKREIITGEQRQLIVRAALVHDAFKGIEAGLVSAAMGERLTAADAFDISQSKSPVVNNPIDFGDIFLPYADFLRSDESGLRGLVAYDLAGCISSSYLKKIGIPRDTISLSTMVGHASCVYMPWLIKHYAQLDGPYATISIPAALMVFVLHYVDDITTNSAIDPNIVNNENALDFRIKANEANHRYIRYNIAWPRQEFLSYPYFNTWKPRYNLDDDATAFQMQRRIGHVVEEIIEIETGTKDKLSLPKIIEDITNTRARLLSL